MKQENRKLNDDLLEQISGGTGLDLPVSPVPDLQIPDIEKSQTIELGDSSRLEKIETEQSELEKIGKYAFGS